MMCYTHNMNILEEEKRDIDQHTKNVRKLILIENLDEIDLTKSRKKKFIKFYYDNLDMNLLEALDEFKKKHE